MPNEKVEQRSPSATKQSTLEAFLPRLRAYLSTIPEVRLAYYQPGPSDEQLALSGPDQARVVLVFTRNVSSEHIDKRVVKIRKHFAAAYGHLVEIMEVEKLEYREACEIAFNAHLAYGSVEIGERDRLYRYNVFLEWNASKRISGMKQDQPPSMQATLDRPLWVVSVPRFITPIYRHLKMIEGHVRDLKRLTQAEISEFSENAATKSLAESYILKSIQSAILVTMSVMHRKMRLSARDYRDLFLHLPVFGMTTRERAMKLAQCADIRDRLMFQYEDVSAVEVYENALMIIEVMQDFKIFMLDWLFEHYYSPSGEPIQTE